MSAETRRGFQISGAGAKAVVSHLMWVLRTELGSSARVARVSEPSLQFQPQDS